MKKEKKPKQKIHGNRIKELLVKKQITPQELCDITGVPKSHLSRIINNHSLCISLPIAMKLSKALNEQVEDVFIYESPNPND